MLLFSSTLYFSSFQSLHCDISSMILDIFSIIDAETASSDSVTEERLHYCYIVKASEKVCL